MSLATDPIAALPLAGASGASTSGPKPPARRQAVAVADRSRAPEPR